MLAHAIRRGVAGFVLDGAIRDSQALFDRNLPVFAAGVTHRGPYRDGPGELGFPISIDGMLVEPGDLVLGDWDGVVVVPQDHAETVLCRSEGKERGGEPPDARDRSRNRRPLMGGQGSRTPRLQVRGLAIPASQHPAGILDSMSAA